MNNKLALVIGAIVAAGIIAGIGVYLNQESTSTMETSQPSNQAETEQRYTLAQVAEHDQKSDCWTVIDGNVYDITSYVPRHPGGDEILQACGTDGSSLFNERQTESGERVGTGTPHSSRAKAALESLQIGTLEQ